MFGNDFKKAVQGHFDFLAAERNYTVKGELVADYFDCGSVTYASDRLWIEVVREKGYVSVRVGSSVGTESCDDALLPALVKGTDYHDPFGPRLTKTSYGEWLNERVEERAKFLRAHLTQIEELFLPDRLPATMARIRELDVQRNLEIRRAFWAESGPYRRVLNSYPDNLLFENTSMMARVIFFGARVTTLSIAGYSLLR